jgi:hypothetical protein
LTLLSGPAQHRARGAARSACADEILVSATTAALAGGAGLTFEDRGENLLKGWMAPVG